MSSFLGRIPAVLSGSQGVANVLNLHGYMGRTDWSYSLSEETNHQLLFQSGQMSMDWNHAVQKAMYLLDPPPVLETLPGAEKFFEFLKDRFAGQDIVIEPAIVLDVSYDMDYCKCYYLQINGECFGTYKTFGSTNDESDFTKVYKGFIPGYVNKFTETHNEYQFRGIPVGKVSLIWDNQRFKCISIFERGEFDNWHSQLAQLVNNNWQRQDGHKEIPFP